MIRSLTLNNFRCFQSFELKPLGQLNLLVGTNNSGKTSILEAVQLIFSQYILKTLSDLMINRKEYLLSEESYNRELDIRHLFYGHQIEGGSNLSIVGNHDNYPEQLTLSIEREIVLPLFESSLPELQLIIELLGKNPESFKLPLSPDQGIPSDYIKRFRPNIKTVEDGTNFIPSSFLSPDKMVDLFEKLVLTPEENLVIQSLQIIEPTIERIAPIRQSRINKNNSSFMVRLSNSNERIPIGSMGDGIWRMLGLTLAMINAKNGVLLVDEIDTGFHFSTMSNMWKLIWENAKRLNIQVFATTHNSDCWNTLATIANSDSPSKEGITIHRIEKDKSKSIVFTEQQIIIAAECGIEVR